VDLQFTVHRVYRLRARVHAVGRSRALFNGRLVSVHASRCRAAIHDKAWSHTVALRNKGPGAVHAGTSRIADRDCRSRFFFPITLMAVDGSHGDVRKKRKKQPTTRPVFSNRMQPVVRPVPSRNSSSACRCISHPHGRMHGNRDAVFACP
jgi:hypothetical protein